MTIPVGAQVPRRGNAFSRWLGRTVLRLMGWRLAGQVPDVPKMVMIGSPHTSNMDGVISIATLIALGLDAGTMIKDSAFKGLLGRFLLWAGAIPINRSSPKGVVEQSVDAFHNAPKRVLLIAPEGTRHGADDWKRGFHHIARAAGVPVLPVTINYRDRIVTFCPPITPGDDYAADLAHIVALTRQHGVGRHLHRLSRPLRGA